MKEQIPLGVPKTGERPWKKFFVVWTETREHRETLYGYSEAEARSHWRNTEPDSMHVPECGDVVVARELIAVEELK